MNTLLRYRSGVRRTPDLAVKCSCVFVLRMSMMLSGNNGYMELAIYIEPVFSMCFAVIVCLFWLLRARNPRKTNVKTLLKMLQSTKVQAPYSRI